MLYLEGPIGSGKTRRLVEETGRLLTYAPASSLLVLCSNHGRQRAFIERLLHQQKGAVAQLPIYTYAGFVRNSLFNYWPLVETEIATTLKQGQPRIRPELSGMEDSELMLKWLLERLRNEAARTGQAVYADFPGNDRHILKQIIRRLRLRSENQLTRLDMTQRSELLDEMCRPETAWVERQFDIQSYMLRVLDTNKQLDIFHSLLKKENAFSQWLKSDIKHLIVDDVDETTAAQQRFIEFLAPSLDSLILAADIDGGSRRGYLNAYPYDWQALKQLRPGESVVLQRDDACYHAGQTLLANWKQATDFTPLPPVVKLFDSFITRVEMLEQVVDDVMTLLAQGYHPGELCLVLPKTDFLGFFQLQHRLHQRGIPVQLISGTQRPSDNPRCKAFVYLLQWANSRRWKTQLSPWEIKTILIQVFQLDQLPDFSANALEELVTALYDHAIALEKAGEQTQLLSPLSRLSTPLPPEAFHRYTLLQNWLDKAAQLPFDQQLYAAFSDLLAPFSDEHNTYGDLNRMIQSYLRQREIYLSFFGESLPPSAPASTTADENQPVPTSHTTERFNQWWLEQVKSGAVADTPEMPEAIRPDALVLGTPQKVIDTELSRKVQFWLDVGSREWARSDNAPLYNAWVHSAVWDGSSAAFSEEFNEAVIRTRAGHITRTLMLLAQENIRAYASELDDLGFAQIGLLKPRLLTEPEENPIRTLERATLRPDQAPILRYQKGCMAISAVPGAGKTFANVELLLELIERGVEADRILVLAYMDSAAKTLLGRLKKKLLGVSTKLPSISTIHSLALRILRENDHSILNGILPDDLTILDDYEQKQLIAKIALATQLESTDNLNEWQDTIDRGIQHAKTFSISVTDIREQLKLNPNNFRLAKFLRALQAYETELHQNASLHFTDLIPKAIHLLQHYPDIRAKYQAQFEYIIEDEAQDSSRLLQTFIHLLGGDTPNLIRTGDTNQSITTTFSSADTSVFRDFVQNADTRVHMDHSSRCAPEIIKLANFWMVDANSQAGLEEAFQPVEMLPVTGQNPSLLLPPSAHLFEQDQLEEEWLRETIQTLRQEHDALSIAILVRSNSQVNRVTNTLQQAGIPAVSLSDQLNAHPVFGLVLTTLKLLAEPGNITLQTQWYRQLVDNQLADDKPSYADRFKSTPLLYEEPFTFSDEWLRQWYYDLKDFSRQAAGGKLSTLIARMADRFCLSVSDRSNGYLCALMAQDILDANQHLLHLSPLEIVIHQFDAFQRSWKGRKGFTEILLNHSQEVVQVMSMHKSKGQEFDVVFMPFLQADSYPHDPNARRFNEADKLIHELDHIVARQAGKILPDTYIDNKKREKIEEEARLIYVGLTRAKRALYLSAHRQSLTRYNKIRNVEPSLAFQRLSSYLHPEENPSHTDTDHTADTTSPMFQPKQEASGMTATLSPHPPDKILPTTPDHETLMPQVSNPEIHHGQNG